ncbi:hypothetical protein WJR50_06150 [Catalinimonas sp. 4WD22]|uniref:hypothetical protein n=1 Tax=Catalinimonas locisalis TaxID=3133978 RepID=UPI0031018752
MEDYFLKKFESKSDQELLQIIGRKEGYQKAAVNAAIELYNERNATTIPKLYDKEDFVGSEANKGSTIRSLDLKPFLRTLSYRDFLTSFALAMFYLALTSVIKFYGDEIEPERLGDAIIILSGFIIILACHIIYKIEHHRANNFVGRVTQDLLFMVLLILLKKSYDSLVYNNNYFSLDDFIHFGFLFLILSVAIELLVTVLRYVLRWFKCQIF